MSGSKFIKGSASALIVGACLWLGNGSVKANTVYFPVMPSAEKITVCMLPEFGCATDDPDFTRENTAQEDPDWTKHDAFFEDGSGWIFVQGKKYTGCFFPDYNQIVFENGDVFHFGGCTRDSVFDQSIQDHSNGSVTFNK